MDKNDVFKINYVALAKIYSNNTISDSEFQNLLEINHINNQNKLTDKGILALANFLVLSRVLNNQS